MKTRRIILYIYYFFGICFTAFLINYGTAGFEFYRRLHERYYTITYTIKLIELLIIATYYSWLISYIKAYGNEFTKDRSPYSQFLLMIMSMTPVIVFHIVLDKLLLVQRRGPSLASTGYFKTDFLFFIIPLIAYTIYVFKHPKRRLFKFRQMNNSKLDKHILKAINSTMEKRINLIKTQFINLERDINPLSFLWKSSYDIPSLRKYILDTTTQHNNNHLHFYDILLIQKKKDQYLMLRTNGLKWMIEDHQLTQIMDNPWLVETKKGTWVNMLYTEPTLVQRRQKPDRRWLLIDEEIWQLLLQKKSVNILANKFESSRRYRFKFLEFWNVNNLRTLDEKRLYERYE